MRKKADKNYLKAIDKMADRYNKRKRVMQFKIGDIVSVRIPRIDRTNSDYSRLPSIIVDVIGKANSLYRLRYTTHSWSDVQIVNALVFFVGVPMEF